MGFEYEAADAATYAEEYEKQQEASNGDNKVPMLYLKKGITQVRVLPGWPGSNKRWYRHIEEHVVQLNGRWITSTCGRAPEYDQQCAFCDLGETLMHEGTNESDEGKTKRATNLRVRHNYLANVICHSSPDPENAGIDKGIMVMKFGTKVKQQLLSMNQDVQGGWADITNVTKGVDFRITRQGEMQKTTYVVSPLAQRSNVAQVLASQGYDLNNMNLFNLDELYLPRSLDDAKGMLEGRVRTPGFRPAPTASLVDEPTPSPAPNPVAPPQQDLGGDGVQTLETSQVPATPEIEAPAAVQVPTPLVVGIPELPPPPSSVAPPVANTGANISTFSVPEDPTPAS